MPRSCVVIDGVSLSHWPVSQTSARSRRDLLAVLLEEARQRRRAALLLAFEQHRDRDRQLAGDLLPGARRLEEGHQLAFVVLGAARDDDLAVALLGGDARLERRRLSTAPADPAAARRSGRRRARAACPSARFARSCATTIGWPVVGTTLASRKPMSLQLLRAPVGGASGSAPCRRDRSRSHGMRRRSNSRSKAAC